MAAGELFIQCRIHDHIGKIPVFFSLILISHDASRANYAHSNELLKVSYENLLQHIKEWEEGREDKMEAIYLAGLNAAGAEHRLVNYEVGFASLPAPCIHVVGPTSPRITLTLTRRVPICAEAAEVPDEVLSRCK